MVQSWFEFLRNRRADHDKAVRRVQDFAENDLRDAMAAYDAFVPQARQVKDGLLLGTARSSQGEEIPLRLPWDREYAHWLVQGGTGTGKTTWVASLLDQELKAGRPFGVIDCKGDLFDAVLRQTAAFAEASMAAPSSVSLLNPNERPVPFMLWARLRIRSNSRDAIHCARVWQSSFRAQR